MIANSWVLFVIGFVIAVYGLRLGSQEFAQMEFLRVRLRAPFHCIFPGPFCCLVVFPGLHNNTRTRHVLPDTLPCHQGELGNVTLADDIYLSVKQSSGLTQGMIMMGISAVFIATLGMCGAVRGSRKCLYCYAVSSMLLLVVQVRQLQNPVCCNATRMGILGRERCQP
jgi:hypothetical protein